MYKQRCWAHGVRVDFSTAEDDARFSLTESPSFKVLEPFLNMPAALEELTTFQQSHDSPDVSTPTEARHMLEYMPMSDEELSSSDAS